jgi:hypothetical protein
LIAAAIVLTAIAWTAWRILKKRTPLDDSPDDSPDGSPENQTGS